MVFSKLGVVVYPFLRRLKLVIPWTYPGLLNKSSSLNKKEMGKRRPGPWNSSVET